MNKLGFLHDNLAKNRLVYITDNFFNVYFMLLVWFFYNNKKKIWAMLFTGLIYFFKDPKRYIYDNMLLLQRKCHYSHEHKNNSNRLVGVRY